MLKTISVEGFKNVYQGANIIDVRSIESYNNNHIEGAKNIEFNKLLVSPEKYLDRINTYYIYCQKGKKSAKLCDILDNLGYKTINISGGYEAWILGK